MGKALIIKGADFSANAIEELNPKVLVDMYTEYVGSQTYAASVASAGWTWGDDIQKKYAGHIITQLSIAVKDMGEITVSKVSDVVNGTPTEICKLSPTGTGWLSFDVEPFEIKSNEYLVLGSAYDIGHIGYMTRPSIGFYRKVGQAGTDFFQDSHIPIKIMGY